MLSFNLLNSDFTGVYDSAFSQDFIALWGATPFKNEISDLSYIRAATCFLQSNENAEVDRRRVLYNYLANIFDTAEGKPLDRSKPILKTDNLLVNRVINNICTLYNEEPARSFEVNGNKFENEDFNKILKKAKINRVLKQAYKLSKLVNEVAVRPYINSNKELVYKILTPDLYRTLKNDLGEIVEIWIPFQTMDKYGTISTKFHIWDSLRYTRKDIEGRYLKFEHEGVQYGYDGYLHNYGKIPYEILKLNDNEIYNGGMWELVLTQIYCNAVDHISNENLLYGGIGLWYLQNLDIKGKLTLNPGDAFITENVGNTDLADPDIRFIQGQAVYNDIQIYKEFVIKNTLKSMGMPSGMLNDNPGLQSGISMKIDRMELNEYRKDDIDVLQTFEEHLINLTIIVLNEHLKTNYPIVEVNTDYQEQSIYLEPQAELDYLRNLKAEGLITPMQYVTRITGNTLIKSDFEAIEFINNNKAYNGTDTTDPNRSDGNSGDDESLQPETKEQQIKELTTNDTNEFARANE